MKGPDYTPQEDMVIRRHYGITMTSNQIAKQLGRSVASVRHRAWKIRACCRGRSIDLSPDFLNKVLEVYAAADSMKHAAELLNAKPSTVQGWVHKARTRT